MKPRAHLWAIGFGDTRRAAEVRDEIAELSRRTRELVLMDIAVAVCRRDRSFTLDGEPFLPEAGACHGPVARLLACLALGAPPMTARAVGAMLASVDVDPEGAIADDFIRHVEGLIRPDTSALFVLDDVGDWDAVLRDIRGLGGTVLKTNVDIERTRQIQSVLAAPANLAEVAGCGSRSRGPSALDGSDGP